MLIFVFISKIYVTFRHLWLKKNCNIPDPHIPYLYFTKQSVQEPPAFFKKHANGRRSLESNDDCLHDIIAFEIATCISLYIYFNFNCATEKLIWMED